MRVPRCSPHFDSAVATLQLAGMDELINLDALKKLTPDEQNNLIAGMKQQAALLNAQNLITELSEKCLSKCISSPGSSLSNAEKQCLTRCMDRFMDTWNLVSQTLQRRLQDDIVANMRTT